jgi:hypothetical protein
VNSFGLSTTGISEELVIEDEENEIIIYAKFESFGEIQTILD